MRERCRALSILVAGAAVVSLSLVSVQAQPPAQPAKKRILVIGAALGFQHDSIADAMATVWKLGKESGLWDAYLRTDYQLITKKKLDANAKALPFFDAIVFANTTGEMTLDDAAEEGSAVVRPRRRQGIRRHSRGARRQLQVAGVRRDDRRLVRRASLEHLRRAHHPRGRDVPRREALPQGASCKRDEIYQAEGVVARQGERAAAARRDETRLRGQQANINATIATSPSRGRRCTARAACSIRRSGTPTRAWSDPDVQKMYLEAIKWALGLSEGGTTPHAKPTN